MGHAPLDKTQGLAWVWWVVTNTQSPLVRSCQATYMVWQHDLLHKRQVDDQQAAVAHQQIFRCSETHIG